MADQSTHSKCLELIALIRRNSPISFSALIETISQNIKSGKNSCFVFFRKNNLGHSQRLMCRDKTIAGHIKLLQALGLITDLGDLELTSDVKATKNRSDINALIQDRLIPYMEKRGCSINHLLRSIDRIKISDPHNLYVDLELRGMSEYDFRRCLFLLSKAGNTVVPYQRKIYTIGK